MARGEMQRGDMQRGGPAEMQSRPRGYEPLNQPRGIENRPAFDRGAFNHNYQSSQGHRIGPYHAPGNWQYQRWGFGQRLPAEFWAEQYWLGDYWLFGLDIPPIGYEWVRYGPDAILVSTTDGEIAQVVYGEFL